MTSLIGNSKASAGANDAWTEICTPAQAGAASIPHNGRQCRWPLTEESRLAIPPLFPRPPYSPACPHQPANIASAAHARSTPKNSESEPGSRVRIPNFLRNPKDAIYRTKKKRKIISKITSFRVNLKISFRGLTMCAYAKWIGSADPRSSISKTERTNRPRASTAERATSPTHRTVACRPIM